MYLVVELRLMKANHTVTKSVQTKVYDLLSKQISMAWFLGHPVAETAMYSAGQRRQLACEWYESYISVYKYAEQIWDSTMISFHISYLVAFMQE